jgi:hypothetical protein
MTQDAKMPGLPQIDVLERGGKRDGEEQAMDRRLFMQLLVFRVRSGTSPEDVLRALGRELERRGVPGVVYEDVNDPRGLGLLSWSEDAAHFVTRVRPLLNEPTFDALELRPEMTMLGRTYGQGHEPKLEHMLIERPKDNVLARDWPFAVWYPLRRTGAFSKLGREEQVSILREHAQIGMAYGQQGLAHDVRLACHGMDAADNEFVVGLLGRTLHPLSHCVQMMRKTRQTSEFIAQMGPFFVGYARAWSKGA